LKKSIKIYFFYIPIGGNFKTFFFNFLYLDFGNHIEIQCREMYLNDYGEIIY
jgi:hypothetical protein